VVGANMKPGVLVFFAILALQPQPSFMQQKPSPGVVPSQSVSGKVLDPLDAAISLGASGPHENRVLTLT